MRNYNTKHNTSHRSFYDLPNNSVVHFPATEQYLIGSGRTYFQEMEWSDLHRLQFDLETYALDPYNGGIFLIAIRDNQGYERIIDESQMSEADMINELVKIIKERDPDIIENHNIFGFDLPFLEHRAKMHNIKLTLGRDSTIMSSFQGTLKVGESTERFTRYSIRGREIIDTFHAVKRWNAIMRELKSEGLKEAAQYFGIASKDREYIDGEKLPEVWKSDQERVRRYALDDVYEVAALSDMLMMDKFILAQMVPMPFEKVATAGPASCVDSLMVRTYLAQSHSLPQSKPKSKFKGGETQLIAQGVVQNVLHADVSSMYPSIMLNYNVKPENDNLDVFLTILRELTDIRLDAKSKLKALEKGTAEYNNINALQSAMKILINSAFGYLGTGFTLFNAPKQAGEVTRHGREILKEMLGAIRELDGQPIEADTDGIYLALPDNADVGNFIKQINEKVNREGIKIDGDEYTAMFSIAKKSYALLTDDGKIIVKGGGLKSRDTEPFLAEFISTGLKSLLKDDVEGLRSAWERAVDKIQDGKIEVEEISKITKLSKSVTEYQAKHKATQPHYEAAIAAGRTDLKEGDRVKYYKAINGWKLSSEFNGDYDKQHYLNRLKQTAQRFGKAFTATDFRTLFAIEPDLFTNATEIIRPQFRIVEAEKKEWIELAHGIKLNKADPNYKVDRHNWVQVNDTTGIDEFIAKHDNVDIYRTQLAVVAEKEPTEKLDQYPRTGDFWMEFEGSKEDNDEMMQALKAAHLTYDIVENLSKCANHIRYRYNGGKSLYLFIPMSVFEKGPAYNLYQKYEKVAQRIVDKLPEELRKIPDMTIYSADRLLRLEGSLYPSGSYDISVPTELILAENWEAIVELSQKDTTRQKGGDRASPFSFALSARILEEPIEDEPDDSSTEQSTELNQEILEFYQEITQEVPNEPPPKGNRGKRTQRKKRAQKEWREHFGSLGIPCAKALADAVIAGESIGFEGRNKLIWELYTAGIEENAICKLFLANGDPTRYGVLEEDTRPDANPCGYCLRDRFNPFTGALPDFDPSCRHFPHLCDPTKCYRAEEYRNNEKFEQSPFDEFRQRSRSNLGRIMDDEANFTSDKKSETPPIIAVDAPMASGKTNQIARKGKELTANGHTVAAFAPTHAACSKIFIELREKHSGVGSQVIATHVHGQREETCIAEMFKKGKGCASCKYVKKLHDNEEIRKKIQDESCGSIFDLAELQRLADEHQTCASAISKILAKPEIDGIIAFAVMPHAYLINQRNRQLIEAINPDYVFVDEADMLIDTMLKPYQESLLIAGSRSRIDRLYLKPCGHACDRCHLHFSDDFTNRIRPGHKLETSQAYDKVGKPEHFLEYLRESKHEVEKMIKSGTIIDIFDFDAIKHNIDRVGQVLSVVPYEGQSPYESLTALQTKLIESPPQGVKVDCLYEGQSYEEFNNDTGQKVEKFIRPPVYVVKIKVERVFTEEGLKRLLFPELAGDQEIIDDEIPEQFGNILPSHLYIDKETAHSLKETEVEKSLKAFLEFANFVQRAPRVKQIENNENNIGWIEMYFETPRRNDEAINEEIEQVQQERSEGKARREGLPFSPTSGSFHAHFVKRAGISYCAIRLRYLDVEGYRSPVKFLQKRKTMMLSGTFLDKERLAEHLIAHSDEIKYIDARIPMHDSCLIIHHNPQMGKLLRGMTGISLSAFADWPALELYSMIAEQKDPIKILHYAVNTRRGNIIYSAVANNQQRNERFYVQNECNERIQIPNWCSAEEKHPRKENWLFFDKIRSSTSRAVDREQFDLLTVHGNGYPDWYDMLPLVSVIREYVNPEADLERVIEYNRQRAVFQTLLRNQRNEHRHVSIYLSGDIHYTDYPDYLRNRVLETNALMRKLKEMYPDDFRSNRQVQIDMIARVVVAFLDKKLNDIDALLTAEVTSPNNPPEILKAVFDDFEFKGNYRKGESSRKVEVDLSNLPDDERYLIESFIDEHRNNTDNAEAYKWAIERLEHVKKCIADKGYVDRVKDKKGKRQDWKKWIEHCTEKKYLHLQNTTVNNQKKTVYVTDKNVQNTGVD